jgi:hypothetical protein
MESEARRSMYSEVMDCSRRHGVRHLAQWFVDQRMRCQPRSVAQVMIQPDKVNALNNRLQLLPMDGHDDLV